VLLTGCTPTQFFQAIPSLLTGRWLYFQASK
jgi:hypothetical protein